MRWLLLVVFVLLPMFDAAGAASGPAPATCVKKNTNLTSFDKKYQDVGWYTKAMSSMMRGMIGRIDQQTTTEIGAIVKDPKDSLSHLWTIVTYHPSVNAIFFLLLTTSVGLLISIVVTCFCRWCKASSGLTPTTGQVVCTLITFLICCVICAAGAFVYFACLKGVKDGIADVSIALKSTTGQISTFVENFHTEMVCHQAQNNQELQDFVTDVTNGINTKMDAFNKNLHQWKVKGQHFAALQPTAQADINVFLAQLDTIQRNLDSIRNNLLQHVDQAKIEISKTYSGIKDNIDKVKNGFGEVEGRIAKILADNDNYASTITTVVQWSIVIPLILCGLMALAFVLLVLRFMVNRAQESDRRGWLSSLGGNVLGVSGYVAMFTGVILFLLSAAIFMVAFASMFFCIGFFDEPDMLIFSAFPHLQQQIGGYITLHDAFISCRNEYPFFDAIGGPKQMANQKLEKVIDQIFKTDFGKGFRTFKVDQRLMSKVQSLRYMAEVENYYQLLYMMDSRAYRDDLLLLIDDALMEVLDKLATMIGKQINKVLNMAPQCTNMMVIWNNAGRFICNGISMPAQGAWMACAICGIASFTVFHWMFKSTRYLKNFNKDDDAGEDSKKKKSRKLTEKSEEVEEEEDG